MKETAWLKIVTLFIVAVPANTASRHDFFIPLPENFQQIR